MQNASKYEENKSNGTFQYVTSITMGGTENPKQLQEYSYTGKGKQLKMEEAKGRQPKGFLKKVTLSL